MKKMNLIFMFLGISFIQISALEIDSTVTDNEQKLIELVDIVKATSVFMPILREHSSHTSLLVQEALVGEQYTMAQSDPCKKEFLHNYTNLVKRLIFEEPLNKPELIRQFVNDNKKGFSQNLPLDFIEEGLNRELSHEGLKSKKNFLINPTEEYAYAQAAIGFKENSLEEENTTKKACFNDQSKFFKELTFANEDERILLIKKFADRYQECTSN